MRQFRWEGNPVTDTWSLFVYGTLKRGLRYHDRFCSSMLAAKAAVTIGRLFDTPYGYPMMTMPARYHWIHGSSDLVRDMATRLTPPQLPAPPSEDDAVVGELLQLPCEPHIMRALDALEDFVPNQPSLYQRVLAPVWPLDGAPQVAWVYITAAQQIGADWQRMRSWPNEPWRSNPR